MAELSGIPSVVITREGFDDVVANAFAGLGFSAEAPQVTFGADLFWPGSGLGPVSEKAGEIVSGLTRWQPRVREKCTLTPSPIKVQGADYDNLVHNINNLFLRNRWSDGLPVAPPTRRRVDWILTGSDLSPDLVVSRIYPRGAIATVETVAICLAMAGGRPEYLPIVLAAVKAMSDPKFGFHRMNTTTCSSYPVVVVSGPAARDVRLGTGYGSVGPDPAHPAGASIGRAISLLSRCVGRAVPGTGTMAIFGGPPRYVSVVLTEDEEGLPTGWDPLNVEQGFARNANSVMVYSISGTINVPGGEVGDDASALASLNRAAGMMGVPNGHYWTGPYNPEGAAGILLLARGTAQGLARLGWTKQKVKEYLWENSKVPTSKLLPRIDAWWVPAPEKMQEPMPIAMSPKGIMLVVTGGAQSGHMMWLQVGCCADQPINAPVKLPRNWGTLLEGAERDLGPLPSAGT